MLHFKRLAMRKKKKKKNQKPTPQIEKKKRKEKEKRIKRCNPQQQARTLRTRSATPCAAALIDGKSFRENGSSMGFEVPGMYRSWST